MITVTLRAGQKITWLDGHGVRWNGRLLDVDQYGGAILASAGTGSHWSGIAHDLTGSDHEHGGLA